MHPLVLATYLALVLAVAGQAVQVQGEAPDQPEIRQLGDEQSRSDDARDTALDRTARGHEIAAHRAESVHADANLSARPDHDRP